MTDLKIHCCKITVNVRVALVVPGVRAAVRPVSKLNLQDDGCAAACRGGARCDVGMGTGLGADEARGEHRGDRGGGGEDDTASDGDA